VPAAAARAYLRGGAAGLRVWARRLGPAAAAAAAVVTLAVLGLAGETLKILYGREFEQYADALRILALGLPVVTAAVVLQAALRAMGETASIFRSYVVAAVVNIMSAFVLTNRYGTSGAAISIVVAQTVVVALYTRSFMHTARRR
jgi:O-antigen/teichoic acid export membrane protein